MRGTLIDLTGQRFGEWAVLRRAPNQITPSGQPRTMWLCRCSCGRECAVGAQSLVGWSVTHGSRRCKACGYEWLRRYERDVRSRRVPGGHTIAQIAEAAGIPLDTVYHRWVRGWPVERLGAPIARRYRVRPETVRRVRREAA